MTSAALSARRSDGRIVDCTIEYEVGRRAEFSVRGDQIDIKATGEDLFSAMQAARRSLDEMGIFLLCQGARRNVWPSRMARDMGGGMKAYQLRLGEQARRGDLVDILAPAGPEEVATVVDQEMFHKQWLTSLRQSAAG